MKKLTRKKISRTCQHVLFPNHPHATRRKPCGTVLRKSVIKANVEDYNLYPLKVYAYSNLKCGLEELLARPGFKELLFQDRVYTDERLSDIHDAKLWSDFKDSNDELYFTDKGNIGCMLNLDWFNPYKNSEYSLGVIYFTLLNLPRQYRFLWENTIIVGIIPGPREPSLDINSFLTPFVDELLPFWNGIIIREPGGIGLAVYKLAVICVSNDIPATTKFCGFINFNAKRGNYLRIYLKLHNGVRKNFLVKEHDKFQPLFFFTLIIYHFF